MSGTYADLEGKTGVVTGGARGIGAAFVEALVRNGVNVVAGDIDSSRLTETLERLDATNQGAARAVGGELDVTDRASHDRLAQQALDTFGRLDFWVNNAGVFPKAAVRDIAGEQMDEVFAVNVDGVLFGAQAAADAFSENGGVIVNMSSVAAFTVRKERAAYGVSKAAVDHLTRFQAVELGPAGIRVNAIAPGLIETDMTQWLFDDQVALDVALMTIPLGRIGVPQELADVALFLLSDASRYVTGHTLVVDGGSRHR